MVAVIHQSKSLNRVLNYNEQKVKEQKANCLTAKNYPKSTEQLTFTQKLNRLKLQAALNERTKVNAVHISLNFDVSEHLPGAILKKIADTYMEKIGFSNQPYLVYQHTDAGHEHLHIVTTNILPDGKRISLHNLGKNQSEKARKEIEIDFELVKADSRKLKEPYSLIPVEARKVIYGNSDTRRAIANVLAGVLDKYNYTSLPELNAVLQQYNVMADRGAEDSRIHNKRGLLYRILNEKGEKVGVPIKASRLPGSPTLSHLEEIFATNMLSRQSLKRHVKNSIDWSLSRNKLSFQELKTHLAKDSVTMVVRQNKDGIIYGLTYIDHKNKVVFNGSDLGKTYSAKGILERCESNATANPSIMPEAKKIKRVSSKSEITAISTRIKESQPTHPHSTEHISLLLKEFLEEPKPFSDFVPGSPQSKRSRKRKTKN